ncbi:MAG: plasmid pRiA4b ORF-3 family protein [Spirochaetota bacterium]
MTTKTAKHKSNKWYQLKICLLHIKPLIWRRFIVNSDIKLPDLHKVIQTVMGWTNTHLHQFVKDDIIYSEPDEDSLIEYVDYRKIKLNQLLKKEKQYILYEYDFGDGWEHKIVLEKIITEGDFPKHPVCIGGKRNCPPEDCGGPYGYLDLLKIISNPENEEYDEMMEWLGGEFDPEYFDMELINDLLKSKNYGVISFY